MDISRLVLSIVISLVLYAICVWCIASYFPADMNKWPICMLAGVVSGMLGSIYADGIKQ